MSSYERFRRDVHDALPMPPGLPSPRLTRRIAESVSRHPRRVRPAAPRLRAWVPALIVLVAAVLAAEPLISQQALAVGRVEILAKPDNGQVGFLSSQAHPANEFRAMTQDVLAGFNGKPEFNSQLTAAEDVERIQYEQRLGTSTVDLVALTHSDMLALEDSNSLEDLTPLLRRLQHDRTFPPGVLNPGTFGTGHQYYIPWLQATYMMVVNRQALQYLPPGADYHHLSYDELVDWGARMEAAQGRKLIGLPALDGPTGGLLSRFLQGYTYPSYTGTSLTGFDSPGAQEMWQMLRRLWDVTDPQSVTYDETGTHLENGDVWVAWDHQARLAPALADSQHFLAIPAPSGPRGLGSMSTVVGLAIPKGAPNRKGAEALIDWLTRPGQQAAAATSLGFFPTVQGVPASGTQAAESAVVHAYQTDRKSRPTVPPVGLGSHSTDFNAVYRETFARIVLRGEDIGTVLSEEVVRLQTIVDDANAACWPPDDPDQRPCRIR